jgi:hypothetical protein
MAVSLAQVHGKAKAYVDALCKLPRSEYAAAPNGHYARDYNALRKLALEVLPTVDERLMGKYVSVRTGVDGSEFCEARFVEIEPYAREIMEQLQLARGEASSGPVAKHAAVRDSRTSAKTYDVEEIRKEYGQAYAPWSRQDDEYLRARFIEGASIEDLVSEFARKPGAIRSRLRKLGLDPLPAAQDPHSSTCPIAVPADGKLASPQPRDTPSRAGRTWTSEEDAKLLRDFDVGTKIPEIAKSLARGVFSVEVRLCKLGRNPKR